MLKALFRLIRLITLGLFLIATILILLFAYATKIEPYRLKTELLTLQTSLAEDLRIVQISDIQISENYTSGHLQKVVRKINEQTPDIVLFTGDLYEVYTRYHEDEALIDTLSAIEASLGKYAIWGNRDWGGGAAWQYESILQQSGFHLLRNESVSIMLNNGEQLFLAGVDDALLGDPDADPIIEAFQAEQPRFSILMTHEPDTADLYADIGFDLILSGHSHGGQVNIPLLPHITTAMAEKYISGLYQLNARTSLYVNSGIGTSRYPIRLGVVPEITVFHLEKGE